jgi:Sulfotransferase family
MLSLSGEAGYITEPFNLNYQPGWSAKKLPHQSLYVCDENAAEYERTVDDIVAMRYPLFRNLVKIRKLRQGGRVARDYKRSVGHRLRRVRPLLKDPYAIFSSEWLAKRYDMDVVIMIRHPAGFASSIKRLNWKRDFRHWADQPLLLRDLLSPFAEEIRDYAHGGDEIDIIDRSILMWNCYYYVVDRFRRDHPEWTFVKYEELADDPLSGFASIYSRLGLEWNDRVAAGVQSYSDEANIKEVPTSKSPHVIKRDSKAARYTWAKRLSEEEIVRIRAGVEMVARRFYSDEDWEVEPAAVES